MRGTGIALGKIVRQLGWTTTMLAVLGMIAAVAIGRWSWSVPLSVDAEHAFYDARIAVAAPLVPQDDRIVIVPYTDETLIATGKRSPLDRATLAKALRRVDAMGAKAIGIDILIDQPQPEDAMLIATFRAMKTPTFLAHATVGAAGDKILYRQQEFLDHFDTAIGGGQVHPASIVLETDSDNVLRRWPILTTDGVARMPNALIPTAPGFDRYQGGLAYRRPATKDQPIFNKIPIDTFVTDALFANPAAAELMAGQVRGKYVLIGGNIEDIDLFQTPLTRVVGSGEARATWGMDLFGVMLAQMLDGKLLQPLPVVELWVFALAVAVAGGCTAAISRRPLISGPLLAGQVVLLVVLPFWLVTRSTDTYGLPAFGWLADWLLAYLTVGIVARALVSEQRKFAQGALGKYLPSDIAAKIIRDPDALRLTGEKREIFVMFSDLEGFTKLSHAIEPEMVAQLLNRYLDMLSEVVLSHGGTIDKFVGDAVVAFWGAPISRPDDGERSVRAAIAMHAAGEKFRAEAPEGVPPIGKTRVGLHFGEAIVGNFGGEGRIQYTALGDSMNTAARLESANKQTKTSVLVSQAVVERCGLDIFRPMGSVILRGRAAPIAIFQPVPDMLDDKLPFTRAAELAMTGDAAAIDQIEAWAEARQDPALANFVWRLKKQQGEGYYVLD